MHAKVKAERLEWPLALLLPVACNSNLMLCLCTCLCLWAVPLTMWTLVILIF